MCEINLSFLNIIILHQILSIKNLQVMESISKKLDYTFVIFQKYKIKSLSNAHPLL
jgi:hypothetical protein